VEKFPSKIQGKIEFRTVRSYLNSIKGTSINYFRQYKASMVMIDQLSCIMKSCKVEKY